MPTWRGTTLDTESIRQQVLNSVDIIFPLNPGVNS